MSEVRENIKKAIINYLLEHGYAPSYKEIGDMVGLKSKSNVNHYIKKMLEDGQLETDSEYSPRAIRVPGYNFVKGGKWIPCSERLPEVIEKDMQDLYPHVLVYTEEEDEWNIYVGIYGMYKPKEWVDAHDSTKVIENVIAWQPLPEPYRGCNNNA